VGIPAVIRPMCLCKLIRPADRWRSGDAEEQATHHTVPGVVHQCTTFVPGAPLVHKVAVDGSLYLIKPCAAAYLSPRRVNLGKIGAHLPPLAVDWLAGRP
jgi:hypothetical protein